MSEQDDEQWITERLDGVGSCADDMRAAIARGYERGKAEGDAEVQRMQTLRMSDWKDVSDLLRGAGFVGGSGSIYKCVQALIADRDRMRAAWDADVAELCADRDRLAKRCEELEALLTRGVEIVEGDDATASRLAALEQRVGGIIEALLGCFGPDGAESYGDMARRLAALRAPGEAPTTEQVCERLSGFRSDWAELTPRQREKFRAYDGPLNGGAPDPFRASSEGVASSEVDGLRAQLAEVTRERDAERAQRESRQTVIDACVAVVDHPSRRNGVPLPTMTTLADRIGLVIDHHLRALDTARRERDEALAKVEAQRVTGEAQVDRDVRVSAALKDALGEDGHTHEFDVAIRKITRQRDEALGVVRRYLDWDPKWGDLPKGTLRGIKLDMRALVAGQPVAESKLDAIMTEREADLIGESLATERGLRDQIATRDAEIERLQERCRAAAHALVGAVGSATPANVEELAQRAATEIETLRAKLAEAERCAQESADIMRRARDRAESYCLRLGEAESQRDAFRAHAIKLDALCVRAANLLRDWCGTEPRALAEDIRARGEVPR